MECALFMSLTPEQSSSMEDTSKGIIIRQAGEGGSVGLRAEEYLL